MVVLCGAAEPVHATIINFSFSGVVTADTAGILFPTKNVGDPFSGSFSLDTNATPTVTSVDYASYAGGTFGLTIDAVSYPVYSFRVWSGGPANVSAPDGVEFSANFGGSTGFLSLRSSLDIYAAPLVPSTIDLGDMDVLAQVSLDTGGIFNNTYHDRGTLLSLEAVPEPGTALLTGLGLAMLASSRRRRRC